MRELPLPCMDVMVCVYVHVFACVSVSVCVCLFAHVPLCDAVLNSIWELLLPCMEATVCVCVCVCVNVCV